MLKNYFKIAWRNLTRNKVFTLLNLGGLTISLSACLIIFFWARQEMNYDAAAVDGDRVYRVGLTLEAKGQPNKQFAVTSPLLAPVLLNDFPEVEKAVRLAQGSMLIGYKDEHFFTNQLFFADPNFFSVFGFPLSKGEKETVLEGTHATVISEKMAKKLFGSIDDAIGKTITANDTTLLTVTGVSKDIPPSTHLHFDLVCPIKMLGTDALQGWWNDSYYTYLLLKKGTDGSAFENKMAKIMDKYNSEQNKEIGLRGLHFLQPLRSIHLHSDLRSEIETNGSFKSLRIFISIAIFLLVVSFINYINLATATSFKRAKEIGMRKVVGAGRWQLMAQFLGESMLLALMAFFCSLVVAQLSLPFFNSIAATDISLIENLSMPVVLLLIAAVVIFGLAAGLYPAFYLAKIAVTSAFKNTGNERASGFSLRKLLVIFQFSLSVIVIIATIVAISQLKYMQSRDLGFDKDQVIAFGMRNQAESEAIETIKESFRKNAGIISVAASSSTPGKRLNNITVLPEGVPPDHIMTMNTLVVDYDFINTYKIPVMAGRGFSKDFGGDSSAFVLNETAVRELGWGQPSSAIGKKFEWGLGKKGTIIGVVKDFHFKSLQNKVLPIVMHLLPANTGWYNYVSARINTANEKQVIASLQQSWQKIFPGHPFEYFFVDEDYNKQYLAEQRLSRLSMVFSVLTIFISCLGLLGLVMIAVAQRIKEVGIRKVLGASVSGIVMLLSKDFLKLIIVALIIASPLGWFLMNRWLQDFAYRINIEWWVFVAASVIAISIAFVTISFQAIRAAVSNPVKSLKTE